MERILVVVWTCHVALVLCPAFSNTTTKTSPRPPRLISCVFLEKANVTCRWEAGDIPAKNYTLKVERVPSIPNPKTTLYTCTTSENSCTAVTKSTARITYCITVIAHAYSQDISSERRCQSVRLNPVTLDSIKPVRGRPQCLNVTWISASDQFPVAGYEVKKLQSQIEFTAEGQLSVQVENVTALSTKSFMVCPFRPDTSYTVKLRHRYNGPQSPWSQWSNAQHGRTGEDAPSVAPPFWRRVIQTDKKKGWRLVSLHWKPLSRRLANGRVLFFNVTCQTGSAQVLSDHGNCSHVNHTNTSCSLHLPEGRCSCKLTASTSAGTSPEAQIWLLGASEAEPPPPRQITATPLDDNSLDVRWMAPVDGSPSGFVVEWFAVKQTEKNIFYWEKLNSSCKSLVITEGVKPMERYVVSVRALYGEQGAGRDGTVQVYTRQGAPTAGPEEVQVQQITGRTAEIAWRPVPVELLRGFIRNYTISYSKENQKVKRVLVPGHVHHCALKNLSPGNYIIYVQANTDAGPGKAGLTKMHIGEDSDEMSIVVYTLLPIMGIALALVLMACLLQSKMVKQKLCQDVPDPSDSSLAYWTPKTTLENLKWPVMAESTDIKYSEVVLLGESELQNSSPDEDLTYHSVCDLQTYSSPCYSPQSVSQAQTAQNTIQPLKEWFTRAKTTSSADLSSCPPIYSSVLCSQMPQSPPTLPLESIYQTNHWQHSTVSVNDVTLQLGGDTEPPASPRSATRAHSPLSEPDEPKTFRYFLQHQHQSPVCFSDFGSISHSSVLLSHPAEVTSPQDPFSQSIYNSVPSLQPKTFSHTVPLTSLSPFPQSLFVDFSYRPLKCDPCTSSVNHQ